MEHNVLISVRGRQRYEGQEPDEIELTTEGTLSREDALLVLTYEESELTGLRGTTTRLEISDDRVVLRRSGSTNSVLEFELGKICQSLYETEVGALLITVCAVRIENHMDETGGNLRVSYTIEIENAGAGEVEYEIVVIKQS